MTSGYGPFGSSLRDLPRLRTSARGRVSSWDPTGANRDYRIVAPGETLALADIAGAGAIDHLWFTVQSAADAHVASDEHEPSLLRELVLSIWWDGEPEPSVCVPLGDFFGAVAPHPHQFSSAPIQVGPDAAQSLSCWWHMPFARGARLELRNEMRRSPARVYYYVDFERFDELEAELGRFHAYFTRENPTAGDLQEPASNRDFLEEGINLTGAENYTLLEASGRGHYVGCVLTVHNLRDTLRGTGTARATT